LPDASWDWRTDFGRGALTLVGWRPPAACRWKVRANSGKSGAARPKSAIVEGLIEEFDRPGEGTSGIFPDLLGVASAAPGHEAAGNAAVPLILDGGESGATLASHDCRILNGDSWKIGRERSNFSRGNWKALK